MSSVRLCSIDGCDRKHYGRDMCEMHYKRLRSHGSPNIRRAADWAVRTPAIDRLMSRVIYTPGPLDTECWIPKKYINPDGYVRIGLGGRGLIGMAHRVAYEALVGPVPDGLELDHLCRVRACCNPAHLEPVTHLENMRRGMSPGAIAVRTNTCRRGHSLADAPREAAGTRRCRACALEGYHRRRATS